MPNLLSLQPYQVRLVATCHNYDLRRENYSIAMRSSAGGFADSIARDMHAEIGSKVLAIVPQLDDWICPVCYGMAWRPINLGCCRSVFCVGCIITDAQTNAILSTGYSRELPGNTHAEECALSKLISQVQAQPQSTSSASLNLYTSMEPCSERLSGSTPCAQRILSFNNDPTL